MSMSDKVFTNNIYDFKSEWYGNDYGGFYIIPELLNDKSIVYSFGIGKDLSFDHEIVDKHNSNIFLFDPTPKSIEWVKEQKWSNNFNFYEYGLSNIDGYVDFYLPHNDQYVSSSEIVYDGVDTINNISVPMKTFSTIISELGHTHIDVLKMDIEGSEFLVIDDILNSDISITQILIEFHGRFIENGVLKTKNAIGSIISHGYLLYNTSISGEEFSFVKTIHL